MKTQKNSKTFYKILFVKQKRLNKKYTVIKLKIKDFIPVEKTRSFVFY